jgi:acetoacetyl-CoA reductase/3-oxoacyl-[acyl-carrier protein] reductase
MKSRVILITGGSSGIGSDLCFRAAEKFDTLIFTYFKNKKKADELKKNLLKINPNIFLFRLDLSKIESINQLLNNIKKNKLHVDVLINNAAVSQIKKINLINSKDWDSVMNANLKGPFFLSQNIVENMRRNKWGRIVNMSSIGGQWGGKDQVHYAISKTGILGMTKSFAKIYSEYNITCNAVSPGLVLTKMSKKEINSKAGKKKIKSIPIGRIANTNEVTEVILFLCDDKSSYITGQTVNVNGGMLFN